MTAARRFTDEELLDVTEVQALLKCSLSYAYQRMRHWPPGFTVRVGRKIVVRRARLLEWLGKGGDSCPGGYSKRPTRKTGTSAGAGDRPAKSSPKAPEPPAVSSQGSDQ